MNLQKLLYFTHNVIGPFLQSLMNLTKLKIFANSYFSSLARLTNLRNLLDLELGLRNRPVNTFDFSYFPNLTRLKSVNEDVSIKNLSILTGLRNLFFRGVLESADDLQILTNITKLDIKDNHIIKDLNYLTNLKYLSAYFCSSLVETALCQLNRMIKLDISNNSNITQLSNMTNLQSLIIRGPYCQISDNELAKLTTLHTLDITGNSMVNDINNLTKLTQLKVGEWSSLSTKGLTNLTNIRLLYMSLDTHILNINHMTNIERLHINGSELPDDGFTNLKNVTWLVCELYTNIRVINNMPKLKFLRAVYDPWNMARRLSPKIFIQY